MTIVMTILSSSRWLVVLAAVACFITAPVVAQDSDASADAPPAEREDRDALGRDTPRGTVEGYLKAAESGDYETAIEYLDLRNLPKNVRDEDPAKLVRILDIVIQRNVWIDLEELSDMPEGASGDGLPEYRDELAVIESKDKEYRLLLQRVPGPNDTRIWKVSNATIAELSTLYEEFGYGPVADYLAKKLPDVRILGIELFKVVLGYGVWIAVWFLLWCAGHGLMRLFGNSESKTYLPLRRFLTRPFAIFSGYLVGSTVVKELGLGLTAQVTTTVAPIGTALLVWLVLSLISLLQVYFTARFERQGRPGAVVLLRPVSNALKVLALLIIFLEWLAANGFNVTTVLAGLGVGGVAVALALQKPLEDFFGAITIFTQQIVHIGDFCKVGSHLGNIEEIGLRSTRMRTLANTLITFPNALLATQPIENYTARGSILYKPVIRLTLDTSSDVIEATLDAFRKLLEEHERVINDRLRVRFERLGEDAYEIVIMAYINTRDFAEFLEVIEGINLQLIAALEQTGARWALPAQQILLDGAYSAGSNEKAATV